MKQDKYPKSRFIDYTECYWGHSFSADKETQTAEGFYKSDDRYIMNGDLAYKMYDDGILIRRVYDVENSNNPNDYYVCKYTVIKSMDDLSEREQKMLNEILGE